MYPLLKAFAVTERIDILFEDVHLLAVNKPAGVLSVPGQQGGKSLGETLAVLTGAEQPLRLVHRRDHETSGVLLLARTDEAQRRLSDQFLHRQVEKGYLAIVRGEPQEESGQIEAPIAPHPHVPGKMTISRKAGRSAETRWQMVERYGPAALLRVWPKTGRQHQIRIHLKLIGLPLLVDPLYGESTAFRLSEMKTDYRPSARREERPLIARLTLHAECIAFVHPISNEPVRIEAPLPKDFRATLAQLRKLAGIKTVDFPRT
jgi:23S rRNA pseudouridine1911/1915/1917 synthase